MRAAAILLLRSSGGLSVKLISGLRSMQNSFAIFPCADKCHEDVTAPRRIRRIRVLTWPGTSSHSRDDCVSAE